ncbi:MAG: alpha/beta fold hydrolase [Trichococcus flocculiformis]
MTAASFTFQSSDGNGNLRDEMVAGRSVRNRKPPSSLRMVTQNISDAMMFLHVKLAEAGIVVYGNDHRGHGKTNGNVGEAICFADEAGFDKVVADMRALTEIIQAENPGIPLFLFGHSMGSMLTRRYIQLYGDDLVGAVLSGSGVFSNGLLKLGTVVAASEIKRNGRAHPSLSAG